MTTPSSDRSFPRWTVGVTGVIVLLNLGVFAGGPASEWLPRLEFERHATLDGESWRLLTFNLVHHTPRHFLLDVGVFLVLGWMTERNFPRAYIVILLWMALVIGLAALWFMADGAHLRGLSGVNAGQFAVALWVEVSLARREPRRWLWTVPATVLFVCWIGYGAVTGRSLWMGDDAHVAGWAHVAGAVAAVLFLSARRAWSWMSFPNSRTTALRGESAVWGVQSFEFERLHDPEKHGSERRRTESRRACRQTPPRRDLSATRPQPPWRPRAEARRT